MNTQLYYAAIGELEALRGHLRNEGNPHVWWVDEILRRFSRAVSAEGQAMKPVSLRCACCGRPCYGSPFCSLDCECAIEGWDADEVVTLALEPAPDNADEEMMYLGADPLDREPPPPAA